MSPENLTQAESVLSDALDRPPEEQDAFVSAQCRNDPALESQVRRLLAAHRAFQAPADAAWPAPTSIGNYEVIEELGSGGMGVVYLGRQKEVGRLAAIKVVLSGMDTRAVLGRFRVEQRALASLVHPNIAALYEVGVTEGGQPFFVMEYVDGKPIDRHCDDATSSIEARLKLFESVCSAVHIVHQNALIHRDISARNVLVTADGTPKLLDFGLAKLMTDGDESVTMSGRFWMTPAYASPEQAAGGAITTSTDIYSLGVLLYFLMSGCLPISAQRLNMRPAADNRAKSVARPSAAAQSRAAGEVGEDPMARAARRGTTPDRLARRLRGDIDNIVMKALEEEPARRYTSADQFRADIVAHLAGRPVVARTLTWKYVVTKFVRRNRAAVAVAAAVTALVIGATTAVAYQSVVARRAQARAERRFNDVRRLANAFLFDFDGAVANLAGSTAARQLVVDRGREYLDSLATEAETPSLVRELATAYQRVGDVQGDPYSQSMGNVDGALASYSRSRELRQRLYDNGVRESELVRELAGSHLKIGDILWVKREFARAKAEYERAKALDEEALAGDPSNTGIRQDLSIVLTGLGDTQAEIGDAQRALESHRQSLAIRDQLARVAPDARSQRNLAVGHVKVADAQARLGQNADAVEGYRRATGILEHLVAEDRTNAQLGSNLIATSQRLGVALANSNRASEGVAAVQGVLPLARRLAALDTENQVAQRDVAATLSMLGEMLQEDNRPAESLPYLREYLSAQEKLARDDAGNAQVQRDLWIAHLQLGRAALAARGMAEAERHARTSLEMALSLWPGLPADPTQMDDLADAYALAARVDVSLRREGNARPYFERALALRQQLTRQFPAEPGYAASLTQLLNDSKAGTR